MMEMLEKLEFNPDEINALEEKTPTEIITEIEDSKELVSQNITFLKDLGVKNYKDIVINYSSFFLMEEDKFQGIFTKYDKEDLIEKLAKNIAIIEHL